MFPILYAFPASCWTWPMIGRPWSIRRTSNCLWFSILKGHYLQVFSSHVPFVYAMASVTKFAKSWMTLPASCTTGKAVELRGTFLVFCMLRIQRSESRKYSWIHELSARGASHNHEGTWNWRIIKSLSCPIPSLHAVAVTNVFYRSEISAESTTTVPEGHRQITAIRIRLLHTLVKSRSESRNVFKPLRCLVEV